MKNILKGYGGMEYSLRIDLVVVHSATGKASKYLTSVLNEKAIFHFYPFYLHVACYPVSRTSGRMSVQTKGVDNYYIG
jgi:hypothetical protein